MVVYRRRVLPLIVIAALGIFEDRVSIPSCNVVVPSGEKNAEEDHPGRSEGDDGRELALVGLRCPSSWRGSFGTGPYDLLHTLPPNATEYIFQALRPMIVFIAHSNIFRVRTHSDGTCEITVPAMTWDARNDPGFVVATFKSNGSGATISHCSLAKESIVLLAYTSIVVLFISTMLVANSSDARLQEVGS